MSAGTERARAVLARYARPDACAANLLCDRHPREALALTCVAGDGSVARLTYGELAERSRRLAETLAAMGVGPGDRVATLMGKGPALVVAMLATWRLGAVYVPLFTAFGPQAIALRLTETAATVVFTDTDQVGKLAPGPDMPADPPWRSMVLDDDAGVGPAGAPAVPAAHVGGGDGPIVHMLTSGTTGRPKGVVHPLTFVAGFEVYLELGLDVRPDDVFWSAADPGWAYGLYSAVIGPLAAGIPSVLVAGGFSAPRTLEVLRDLAVTNMAAAPTAYRALKTADWRALGPYRVRCASSAGEPLTPDVNAWAREALGVEVRDHYGQTELGMCVGNHQHPDLRRPVKDGSMGRALPGWSLAVLRDDADEVAPPDTLGRPAVDVRHSPLMTFRGYHGRSATSDRFTADGRWYLTGDAARQDADGDVFFAARGDDVIIMAGYRIGPFDVESVLAQHAAVAECAVIAAPDEARGEVLEAYVVAREPHVAGDRLARELQQLVKERYAAYAYPRAVHFVDALPKTPSGKIQRYLLRERREAELGATAR